jgi:heat shock protein HtpX
VKALMQYAGGHDPGPLAIESPRAKDDAVANQPPPGGPWGGNEPEPPGPQGGPWGAPRP